uniref:Uncharacterized protein n=1 Tax=Corvus moneduloides TaxID=1196302 RepID=A0A8U7P091_CORMO
MKNRPVLAVLLFLALPLALARRAPAAAPPGPAPLAQVRPSGGERRADPGSPGAPGSLPTLLTLFAPAGDARPGAAAVERDMHDFFVGLMGKRAAEPGRATGRGSGGPAPRCSPGPPAPGEAPLRAA